MIPARAIVVRSTKSVVVKNRKCIRFIEDGFKWLQNLIFDRVMIE